MQEISLFDAKTHLSSIISAVEQNHTEFVITKRGKQVAKIVPMEISKKPDIEQVFQEMDNLKIELRKAGLTLKEILQLKNEGRK